LQNQFFISGLSGDDTIKNRVLEALYRRILRAEKEKRRFRVIIVIPLLPGFQVACFCINDTMTHGLVLKVDCIVNCFISGWH
jgi:hypothetical protein